MEFAFGVANALNAANWGIFEAADDTSFVTSDNPVFPHYPKQEGFYPTRSFLRRLRRSHPWPMTRFSSWAVPVDSKFAEPRIERVCGRITC